jgi:hypothetical protein
VAPIAQPDVVVKLKGLGSKIVKANLKSINYVVSWTAKGATCFQGAGCVGTNFQVDAVRADGNDEQLFNEITADSATKVSSGETLYQPNSTGVYLIKVYTGVEGSNLAWTITFTPAA